MKNQFTYTRREPKPLQKEPAEGEERVVEYNEYTDSFNVDMVVRSLLIDKVLIVLLNDIHERIQEIPIRDKHGRVTGHKRERNTVQTEIHLEGADIERYRQLTTITI